MSRRGWRRRGLAVALLVGAGAGVMAGSAVAACPRDAGDHAVLHVPASAGARPPLVLAFPGLHGTPARFARDTGLSATADREGFVIAYMSPRRPRAGWPMRAAVGTADVAGVRRVLDRLASCVDTDRVVVAGFSNGAGFGARIACELAPRLHGAVLVAGSYRAIDPCPSDGPRMPIAELHAAGDPHAHAAAELVATWRRRDGCTAGADCPVSSTTLPGHRHAWPDAATAALTRLLR